MKVWKPTYHMEYSDWHIHATVVHEIVRLLRPTVFVELGVKYGQSFFSIIESMLDAPTDEKVKLGLAKRQAHAVDVEILPDFVDAFSWMDAKASGRIAMSSSKATAVESATQFKKRPKGIVQDVDILHIDSYHSYASVKADFEAWLPLMSKKGLVLFHDSSAILPSNGVAQLLRELKENYAIINFTDGEGLAVLFMPEALYLLPSVDALKEDWITNNR